MKNLKEIKSSITQKNLNKVSLIDALVLKNIKGGINCPPPIGND